jgi:hypothetical protein
MAIRFFMMNSLSVFFLTSTCVSSPADVYARVMKTSQLGSVTCEFVTQPGARFVKDLFLSFRWQIGMSFPCVFPKF